MDEWSRRAAGPGLEPDEAPRPSLGPRVRAGFATAPAERKAERSGKTPRGPGLPARPLHREGAVRPAPPRLTPRTGCRGGAGRGAGRRRSGGGGPGGGKGRRRVSWVLGSKGSWG